MNKAFQCLSFKQLWNLGARIFTIRLPLCMPSLRAQVLEFGEMTVAALRIPQKHPSACQIYSKWEIFQGILLQNEDFFSEITGRASKMSILLGGQGESPWSWVGPRMDFPEKCQCIRARRLGVAW